VFFNWEVWKRLTQGRSSRQQESQHGNVLHLEHLQLDNRMKYIPHQLPAKAWRGRPYQ
jgi:hypothetical protein